MRRGWWGFNTDRVKHIHKKLRDEKKAASLAESDKGRAGGRVVGRASALQVEVPGVDSDAQLDTPRGTGHAYIYI